MQQDPPAGVVVHGELIEAGTRLAPWSSAPPARPTPPAAITPRVSLRIRPGSPADLPFIDALQKAHSRELGFLPRMALEGKIRLGQVLVAETTHSAPLGYLIAADRYFKRDEIGYITQINVLPAYRRSLVAGALLQAQFDRSAYGCRLYCCWCAQDLKANEFWEAMGFVPIAFRTGSRTKGKNGTPRIHIFWQKRIRAHDSTPWWYPSQTGGGELREDRIVFPIPAGMGWRDVLPVVLPGEEGAGGEAGGAGEIVAAEPAKRRRRKRVEKRWERRQVLRPRQPTVPGGLWFENDLVETWELVQVEVPVEEPPAERPAIDPRLTAMARELRDRWSERALFLPEPGARYDVRRTAGLDVGAPALEARTPRLLPEAA